MQLVKTIDQLYSKGLRDTQIASYLNSKNFLTPRGKTFLPQHVFSIRKKNVKHLNPVTETYEVKISDEKLIQNLDRRK